MLPVQREERRPQSKLVLCSDLVQGARRRAGGYWWPVWERWAAHLKTTTGHRAKETALDIFDYFLSPLDFVSSYLRDLVLPSWIGLSDLLVENQYGWSDGVSPVLYTNWNEKEPNNAGGAVRTLNYGAKLSAPYHVFKSCFDASWCLGQEHCVAMSHNHLVTGKWNDDACQKNHSFVCYRKKCRSLSSCLFCFKYHAFQT